MKRLFTLLVAATLATFAHAQYWTSVLNLRLENNAHFIAWVDGRQVNQPSNRVTVENLQPGRHQLRIAVVQNVYGVLQTRVIFNSFMKFEPNRVLFACIDRFSNFVVERSFAMNNHFQNRPYRSQFGNDYSWFDDDYYYNYNQPANYPNANVPVQPVVCNLPGSFQPVSTQPVLNVVDAVTFQQLKDAVINASFESTKLNVLKQAVPHYFFTTSQVREIVGLFSFESTKLDVAKMLYDKTIDKQNYFNISQAFSFSSSVDALSQYVAQR